MTVCPESGNRPSGTVHRRRRAHRSAVMDGRRLEGYGLSEANGQNAGMTTHAGTREFEGATFVRTSFKGATLSLDPPW